MCIRCAANETISANRAWYRNKELVINENINRLIDKARAIDENDADNELINESIEIHRAMKGNLVSEIGKNLEKWNAKKWYNEGEMSNIYFFNLLNQKIDYEISELGDRVTNNRTEINQHITNLLSCLSSATTMLTIFSETSKVWMTWHQ